MSFLEITRGDSPLVLGLPHTGTEMPDGIEGDLNETGQALADTDWHIHELYAGLIPEASAVRTRVHRYVIDVNRDPGGHSLYPGQNTTALCPLTDFDGREIYRETRAPDADEIERRRLAYHAPYHAALLVELDRVKSIHGFAVLYDCHSIRSEIPFLFPGYLPDFNIGTNCGETCAPAVEAMVKARCQSATGYTHVLNGRFKGGWTTRHYGRPDRGFHAIQMELAQSTYMQERPPWRFDTSRAGKLRDHLKPILEDLIAWRPE